jgi:hypothetical protein
MARPILEAVHAAAARARCRGYLDHFESHYARLGCRDAIVSIGAPRALISVWRILRSVHSNAKVAGAGALEPSVAVTLQRCNESRFGA